MNIKTLIAKYFVRKIKEKARISIISHKELWSNLQHYATASKSTGCSFEDYAFLYNWIVKNKPREVLECGTGFSTVVIMEALAKNGMGRLTSMEENEDYFNMARKAISTIDFESSIVLDMLLSPAVEDTYDMFRGVRYKDLPKRDYDFVFIDGPDLHMKVNNRPLSFDMDFLTLVGDKPISAIIDKRLSTCYVYSQIFPSFKYDPFRELGILEFVTKKDMLKGREIAYKKRFNKRYELWGIET